MHAYMCINFSFYGFIYVAVEGDGFCSSRAATFKLLGAHTAHVPDIYICMYIYVCMHVYIYVYSPLTLSLRGR